MKKILLFVALISIFFFTSCEKEKENAASLTGTSWINTNDAGSWEAQFTHDQVTFSRRFSDSDRKESYTGTYVYNHPIVTMELESYGEMGKFTYTTVGTIENKIMKVTVMHGFRYTLELREIKSYPQ
jgi:hypothetical protein